MSAAKETQSKAPIKYRLLWVAAIYLAVFFVAVTLYGALFAFPAHRQAQAERRHQAEAFVLTLSLLFEQCGEDYPLAVARAQVPAFCDRIRLDAADGQPLFNHGDPSLSTTLSGFHSGNLYSVAETQSHLFYSMQLSGRELLTVVISQSALKPDSRPLVTFGVATLILAAVSVAVFFVFRSTIYLPIRSIENAVDYAIQGDMDFNLNIPPGNEFYELSQKMNTMLDQMREILQREYSSKILRTQSEIHALQSQINPHFLYNTLDSIRGQALMQGSFEIANLLKSLSSIFRYSIGKTSSMMTLADEFSHMDHYLNIQQYRFSNKFDVVKFFDGDEQELLRYNVPKLTLQPIVENSVFHGLETKKGKGRISIYVYSTEKRLIIEIEDNGIGIEPQNLDALNRNMNTQTVDDDPIDHSGKRGTSIALKNVNQRIRLLYGPDYGLQVFSTVGIGTRVQVILPLVK